VDTSSITSVNGAVYLEYQGAQIATWNGTNAEGDPVSNGVYYVKIDNVDAYGQVSSVEKVVTVSRAIARVEVNILNEAGEVVRHIYGYVDDPDNLSSVNVDFSTSVLQPTDGAPAPGGANVVHITSSAGMDLQWDGRSDSGAIVTNGQYFIEVHYVDGRGSDTTQTHGIVVQSANEKGEQVYAMPNVLRDGQTTATIGIESARIYTLRVQLYDVAGELIKTVTGETGRNGATLDVKGLSSGLYIAVVELRDADGKFAARRITKLVIQH
jgi:flagellar hook assembly protein FlgD